MFVYVKDGRILRVTPLSSPTTTPSHGQIECARQYFHTAAQDESRSIRLVIALDCVLTRPAAVPDETGRLRSRRRSAPRDRGISEYERIDWDTALDIVANEIMRVRRQHGPGAVFTSYG